MQPVSRNTSNWRWFFGSSRSYGRVAIVIPLYFLTPVWSTLIGRYVMGWRAPRLRLLAIVVGLAGLSIMRGSDGELPIPRGAGEWMALIAGILWPVGTTGMHARSQLDPGTAAFVFALGAAVTALILAPLLEPLPSDLPADGWWIPFGLGLVTGGLWWGLSIAALLWATVRLEPARFGILLMTEVLVGAVSASVFAAERLAPLELVCGVLVLRAGMLEVWPVRQGHGACRHRSTGSRGFVPRAGATAPVAAEWKVKEGQHATSASAATWPPAAGRSGLHLSRRTQGGPR